MKVAFKEADIIRGFNAAKKSGFEIKAFEIIPDGIRFYSDVTIAINQNSDENTVLRELDDLERAINENRVKRAALSKK